MTDLKGRCVLVTGASRGIGLAVAKVFIKAGAEVTILAEDAAVGDVGAKIGAKAIQADVTDAAARRHCTDFGSRFRNIADGRTLWRA